MKCSSALCLVEVPPRSSSLFASCRRSTWLPTNQSTVPLSNLREAFDHAARKGLRWALRSLDVKEWAVHVKCCGKVWPINGRPMTQVDVDGTMLDVEAISGIWVICCALVWTVTVPLPPYIQWSGESSENYCPSSIPGSSCLRCTARCIWPTYIRLCSTMVKCGDGTPWPAAAITTTWSGSKHKKRDKATSISLLKKLVGRQVGKGWYIFTQLSICDGRKRVHYCWTA